MPAVPAKNVAALAAARDRAEYLDAIGEGTATPGMVADQRAADALNAEPVTTAALIVTYGAVLQAHESVRRSLKLRPLQEHRASAEAVLRMVARRGGRSWVSGKSDDDRRALVRVDRLAQDWADRVLAPALRDRMGV